MSKALSLLKLFFSLVSVNFTELTPATTAGSRNSTNISLVQSTFAPIILKHVERLSAYVGQAARFNIPNDKYYKIEDLELELLTKHRGEIAPSSWLRFDKKNQAIVYFPLPGNEGYFNYLLVARHRKSNKEIEEKIEVRVREQDNPHNHEIVLSTTLNFVKFSTDVMTRFNFVQKIAMHCTDKNDPSNVWLKSYNKEAKTVTISFNTLGYNPCNLDAINKIKSRMVDSESQVKPSFRDALSPFTINDVTVNLIGPCDPNSNGDTSVFNWGWLKHVLPLLILLGIVGIPVGISCVVRRTRPKRRVAGDAKSRRGRLGQNKDDLDFPSVHFSNRHPSMLSVVMTSKEEQLIPNGSASNHSPIIPNRRTGILNAKTDGTKLNTSPMGKMSKSMVNVPVNGNYSEKTVGRSMVNLSENENKKNEVFVGTSEFNFPCYYNFDPNQPQEPEKPAATFESLGEFAEAISSKLKDIKDVGKSVMNVSSMFGQTTEGATERSLNLNDTETVQQQVLHNTSEGPELMGNYKNDQWGANSQFPETQEVARNKQQTPNSISHITKTDGQSATDTDLMQHVLERMSNASGTLHGSDGHMPTSNVSTQNFETLNISRKKHNTKGHVQNATNRFHSTKIQPPGTGYMPDSRAQNSTAMQWTDGRRVYHGNMTPNHVPGTNVNQNSRLGVGVSSFNHGTTGKIPLRKSFSQSGFDAQSYNHGTAMERKSRKTSAPGGISSSSNFYHGAVRETQSHNKLPPQGGVGSFNSLRHGTAMDKSSSQSGVGMSNFNHGFARERTSHKPISQGGVSVSSLNYGTAREARVHKSSSQGDVNFYHGTEKEMQSRNSHSLQGEFNAIPRRKMSVYEPPNTYRLHPAYGQLSRSKSELSLHDTHKDLEQTRVLSKSDLCLYQSTSEVSLYGDYGEIRMKSELSLYDMNEYSHDNNMYETHVPTEDNAGYITPAFQTPNLIPSEYRSQDVTALPDNLTLGNTLLQDRMQDQMMSSHIRSANAIPEYRRSSIDIRELPVFTVDDYDFGEKQSVGLSNNFLNRDTTKSMLNLPIGKRGSHGAQYEFGFTPTSSYEDTRSPRQSYHEYINPLPVTKGSVNHPPGSSSERGGTSYNLGGTTYQQVPTECYWDEAEYEKDNQSKQQSDDYGTFAKSMPNLHGKARGYNTVPSSDVRNSTSKKPYLGNSEQEKRSLLTKMFSGEKSSESPAGATTGEDATMVGFLKTTVSSLLGPTDGNSSKWFFKNDNAG